MYKCNPKNDKYVYKKRHCYTYIIKKKKKKTPPIYCLQILQGQLCGTHLPNFYFETVGGMFSFIFAGIVSQILVPKLEILPEP